MKDVIEFQLDDQSAIAVEVEPAPRDGFRRISKYGGKRDEDVHPREFDEALERVRPMADRLINKLRDLAEQPDKVEVEFGIKLSAEVGALIASGSTEANFRVTLEWNKER